MRHPLALDDQARRIEDYLSKTIIGVRTDDALYRFAFIPMGGGIYLGHHVYRDDVDVAAVTSAWAAWLDGASRPARERAARDLDRPHEGRKERVDGRYLRSEPLLHEPRVVEATVSRG